MDGQFELVAGALSSDAPARQGSGRDLGLAPDRVYTTFAEMAAARSEPGRGIEVVSIVHADTVITPVGPRPFSTGA